MHLIEGMSDDELFEMGNINHELSNQINSTNWVNVVFKILRK